MVVPLAIPGVHLGVFRRSQGVLEGPRAVPGRSWGLRVRCLGSLGGPRASLVVSGGVFEAVVFFSGGG